MFAVIEDGSHQYRVQEGDTLTVDYRVSSSKGDILTFAQVLLANAGGASAIGHPAIEGATVEAEVVDTPAMGPKIGVQKIRRRKNSRTYTGHRQKYTSVVIKSIDIPGLEVVEQPKEDVPKEEPQPQTDSEAGDAVADESTVASHSEEESAATEESASETEEPSEVEEDEDS